jgi:hypothetical protein
MSEVKACKQATCPVNNGGECLEGLELKDCTHFYLTSDTDEITANDDSEINNSTIPPKPIVRTQLFSANELTLEEIPTVTSKYACQLVIILGDLKSGKTTLLGTIFDLFQLGHFKQFIFGGSLTQKGFEIRSHLSRLASGRNTPETERTKTLEFRVLHLGIRVEGRPHVQHMLLSDVSGEIIRQARNSSGIMKKKLEIAKFADHLFYILDGDQLSYLNKAKTILNAELFIQSAINNQIFTSETTLNILITKWDKLKNELDFDFEAIKDRLNTRFASNLQAIRYSKMASRPDENVEELDLGYGVKEFLAGLLEVVPKQHANCATGHNTGRYFDMFKTAEFHD